MHYDDYLPPRPRHDRRYDVYKWELTPWEGWHRFRAGVKLWTVRRALRVLFGRGYSHVSIKVARVA